MLPTRSVYLFALLCVCFANPRPLGQLDRRKRSPQNEGEGTGEQEAPSVQETTTSPLAILTTENPATPVHDGPVDIPTTAPSESGGEEGVATTIAASATTTVPPTTTPHLPESTPPLEPPAIVPNAGESGEGDTTMTESVATTTTNAPENTGQETSVAGSSVPPAGPPATTTEPPVPTTGSPAPTTGPSTTESTNLGSTGTTVPAPNTPPPPSTPPAPTTDPAVVPSDSTTLSSSPTPCNSTSAMPPAAEDQGSTMPSSTPKGEAPPMTTPSGSESTEKTLPPRTRPDALLSVQNQLYLLAGLTAIVLVCFLLLLLAMNSAVSNLRHRMKYLNRSGSNNGGLQNPTFPMESPTQWAPHHSSIRQVSKPSARHQERGTPEMGTRVRSTPERGTPERGTRGRGIPERGTRGRGISERGTRERGIPEKGTYQRGTREPLDDRQEPRTVL